MMLMGCIKTATNSMIGRTFVWVCVLVYVLFGENHEERLQWAIKFWWVFASLSSVTVMTETLKCANKEQFLPLRSYNLLAGFMRFSHHPLFF